MEPARDSKGLTDKDKFEAAMKLAEFIFSRIQDRRQYEWKIILGFWALLATAPLYIKSKPPIVAFGVGLFGAVIVFCVAFIHPLIKNHEYDSKDMFARYHQAENIAGLKLERGHPPSLGPWWGLFQGTTTLLLAFAAFYLIEFAPIAK